MINLFRPLFLVSTRPHRISRLTFLFYSLDLLHKVTCIFWALACNVALPLYPAFVSSFCPSSQDFIPHFLQFHFTMDTLCFLIWLAILTSILDFHQLVKRHACRTLRKCLLNKHFPICFYSPLKREDRHRKKILRKQHLLYMQ